MADITETRRKKLLVHLHKEGGAMAIGPLHDWSGLKLLAAHQAFSQLMEGLTADGLVTWDGTIFTLTAEGKAAAEAAGKSGKRKQVADGDAAAEAAEPVAAPVAAPAEDPGHSHDHDHGHSHDHGGSRVAPAPRAAPAERPPPASARRAPPPPPPAEKGVTGLVKRLLRRLLKMER